MNEELEEALYSSENTQYDDIAKEVFSNKEVLANILSRTLPEFKGMSPKDIIPLIEEDIKTHVPLDPGVTNRPNGKCGKDIVSSVLNTFIKGRNTESAIPNEGKSLFDVVFYVRVPFGHKQIIVNVELQKNSKPGYSILNRAIFYIGRLLSSEKTRDFVESNYDDLVEVASIWICMNMKEECMTHYYIEKEDLLGDYDWGGNINLMNIYLVGITNNLVSKSKELSLHRFVETLLSVKLTAKERKDILESEFNISFEPDMERKLENMCNLSQGIFESGKEEGIVQGVAQGIDKAQRENVLRMHSKNYNNEMIADALGMELKEVKAILKEAENAKKN